MLLRTNPALPQFAPKVAMVGILFSLTSIITAQTTDLDNVLRSAAKASGVDSARNSWRLVGSARTKNRDQSFEMIFDDRLRFRTTVSGPLPEASGFDGSNSWISGSSGRAHRVILAARDTDRLLSWTETGDWARAATPLNRSMKKLADGYQFRLQPKDGIGIAHVILDSNTFLPRSFESEDDRWNFDDYQNFDGRSFPTRITHKSGAQSDVIQVQSAKEEVIDRKDYAMPNPTTSNAAFNDQITGPLEVKRVSGLIFIHPLVDSRDVGWFIFDTGADVMCIDPSVANQLGMEVVGGDSVAGAVARSQFSICRGQSIQLGAVTLNRPTYLEFDLSGLAKIFKFPVAGICGYDFIASADFDIDTKANTLRVSRPAQQKLPLGAHWTSIRFDSNSPCTECSFPGGDRGYFRLDTGSSSNVDFSSPAVERYHLLNRKNLKPATTAGAGGSSQSWVGPIDWFDLAGNRFEKPIVGFQVAKVGSLATPYLVGNIGMAFMGKFRLILDYSNERLAFVQQTP